MDVRIRETNSEINKYDEQRRILKRQKNSLGLFKGKQKAEIKNQIDILIAKINSLPTEESIRDEYQTKFNKIDMDAKTKILETEKKIKEKYVMPKLEDFDRE